MKTDLTWPFWTNWTRFVGSATNVLSVVITPLMSFGYFKHTIVDVSERTALTTDFINRAHSKLSGYFKDHRTYGDNNQVRFSDSGLIVWDRIAQLKHDNKNLPEIAHALDRDLQKGAQNQTTASSAASQTLRNGSPNQIGERGISRADKEELDLVEKLYERLLEAKEKELGAKDRALNAVEDKIRLLLPEGKTPEQLQAELSAKQRQEAELQRLHQRDKELQELLHELEKLDGKWWTKKERKRIVQRLAELGNSEKKMIL